MKAKVWCNDCGFVARSSDIIRLLQEVKNLRAAAKRDKQNIEYLIGVQREMEKR